MIWLAIPLVAHADEACAPSTPKAVLRGRDSLILAGVVGAVALVPGPGPSILAEAEVCAPPPGFDVGFWADGPRLHLANPAAYPVAVTVRVPRSVRTVTVEGLVGPLTATGITADLRVVDHIGDLDVDGVEGDVTVVDPAGERR